MEYGLQLYSVRDITGEDLEGALAKVAALGYHFVEFAGFFGHSADKVKAMLDTYGLTVSGTHTGWQELTAERIDEILLVEGIDEIFVGLNDLSLGYGMSFMFQLLADGTVERLCGKFREKGIPYGFGGIAAIGQGLLPAERVIAEHYRLGSECVILSRSFCNATGKSLDEVQAVFEPGVAAIRARETECGGFTPEEFESNRQSVVTAVAQIREIIAAKKKA